MPITKTYRLPVSACPKTCESMWVAYECWEGKPVVSLVPVVLLSSGIKAHRHHSRAYWW